MGLRISQKIPGNPFSCPDYMPQDKNSICQNMAFHIFSKLLKRNPSVLLFNVREYGYKADNFHIKNVYQSNV